MSKNPIRVAEVMGKMLGGGVEAVVMLAVGGVLLLALLVRFTDIYKSSGFQTVVLLTLVVISGIFIFQVSKDFIQCLIFTLAFAVVISKRLSMKDIRWNRSARTGFRRTLSMAVLANADTVLSQLFGLAVSTATLCSTSVASDISCSSPYPHKVAGAYFSLRARSRTRADMPHALFRMASRMSR